MQLIPNSKRPFPYLLPSDILGRSLNLPSGVVPTNPLAKPMVSRLATHLREIQSAQNPLSNPPVGGDSIPSISFLNVGSQFVPPTSQPARGSYVPVLHNTLNFLPSAARPSGHAGFGPIGPSSQPHVSALVPPQKPNISNQYLISAQYNNPLYVPYHGGFTNQWYQPNY